MDPLSALSVAASVVQFVDFGSSLVSKTRDVYKSQSGALESNIELENICARLKALALPLAGSPDDEGLQEICAGCVDISNELGIRLEKLKVPPGHNHKKWKSFRQALKSVWAKERIEDIKRRLDDFRLQLDTHIRVVLRDRVDAIAIKQDERFSSLDSKTQEIMLAVLDGRQIFKTMCDDVIEAIDSRDAKTIQEERQQRELHVQHSLLQSLRFDTMKFRFETIAEAHRETFKWIFSDSDIRPWSSFRGWLQSGSGVYWLSGKAGSGKSTLMKYIVDNTETRALCKEWAQDSCLEMPSFFFWKAGTLDQRSPEGLLKSLLHDILLAHPDLIASVFPDEWTSSCEIAASNVQVTFNIWTLGRLQKAFQRLLDHTSQDLKLCFFIDGFDEFEGDHEELAEYFSNLSTSPFVKFCISSRPWPIFKEIFRGSPQLKLQDLTYKDVQQYVETALSKNHRMINLMAKEPLGSARLINRVTDRADGVFLWVTLVVKSLLKGLTNRDSISILENRLEVIPGDLQDLYRHMIHSIDPLYMEEASKLFQLFQSLSEAYCRRDMELVYRALTIDMQKAMAPVSRPIPLSNLPVESLTKQRTSLKRSRGEPLETGFHAWISRKDKFDAIVLELEPILQSRCGGLIEVIAYNLEYVNDWSEDPVAELNYIHATVPDYVKELQASGAISPPPASWNPHTALLMASILRVKHCIEFMSHQNRNCRKFIEEQWRHASRQARYIALKGCPDVGMMTALLDEFDRAATDLYQSSRAIEIDKSPEPTIPHWSYAVAKIRNMDPCTSFISAAMIECLPVYVNTKLRENPFLLHMHDGSGTPLLIYTFLLRKEANIPYAKCFITMLLYHGANPNDKYHGHSVWEFWLHIMHVVRTRSWFPEVRTQVKAIFEEFLKHGANLEATCIEDPHVWLNFNSDKYHTSSVRSKEYIFGASPQKHRKHFQNHQSYCNDLMAVSRGSPDHSLIAIIKDCFITNDEPDGADSLLQLVESISLE